MSHKDRGKAQFNPADDEQQHQRYAHDNFAVQHGDVSNSHVNGAETSAHVVDADGSQRPYQSSDDRGQQGDDQSSI